MTVKTALLPVSAILVIALTACTPGGGGSGGSPAALTGADCIPGDWTADLDDLGGQLAAYFVEKGLGEDLTVAVTGSEEATFTADHTATATDDAVFTFTGSRAGAPMTMTQTHEGGFTSDWKLTGDTFDFQNFDGQHYSITTTVEINGTTTTLPVSTEDYANDIPITTDCTGDVMTMKPENSPFTTTWHRD
ncbi:MAG: hypothetical protein JWP32_1434 [Schumannella sp.]|nr:hypothetical protein [Schumannella sp.]